MTKPEPTLDGFLASTQEAILARHPQWRRRLAKVKRDAQLHPRGPQRQWSHRPRP